MMRSLSGRLLVLTTVFVMLVEILIFLPSLARFREDYLRARLDAANIVAIARLDPETGKTSAALERRLLASAEVRSIALRRDSARFPVLNGPWGDPVVANFRLDDASAIDKIVDAVKIAWSDPDSVIRVLGAPDAKRSPMGDMVEITMRQGQLKDAMLAFGIRIFFLSLAISLLTAALVYLSLNRWLVRPIRDLIANMTAFREAPEAARIIAPSNGQTEIDEAQRELSTMQTEVRTALLQKTRLAALGEAVAKINHDLRNMLAVAQLLADRLERSDDPLVTKTAPKLLRSLDRATALCTHTLAFGKVDEPAPQRRRVMLAQLFEEVRDAVLPEDLSWRTRVQIEVDASVYAEADPDQLFRVIQNLMRNAHEAIDASGRSGVIRISAHRQDNGVVIDFSDTGPGLPVTARDNLFKAFKGSVRKGGTGLGLYIARELVQAHSGSLDLVDSTTAGTTFRIVIPDAATATS